MRSDRELIALKSIFPKTEPLGPLGFSTPSLSKDARMKAG